MSEISKIKIGNVVYDIAGSGGGAGLTEITYSELVALCNESGLTPGGLYRITDYETITVQDNTRSAGHVFDIIVTALDESTLSENASAIQHNGDTYFSDSNLNAWQVWYCLDNDKTRFAWADDENGKGVIYRLIDEYNNDCPYDFKNIQFKRYAVTDITSSILSQAALNALKQAFVITSNGGKYYGCEDLNGNDVPVNGNGASYSLDYDDNVWYYTFQGLESEDGETISRLYDMSTEPFKLSDECIEYLINDGSGTDTKDCCMNNTIESMAQEYVGDDVYFTGKQVLNNIVFICGLNYCFYVQDEDYWEYSTGSAYANKFKMNCYCNTFGNYCYNNTFGNGCGSNTFGNGCNYNTFGNNFQNNTFGNGCNYNTFGNNYRYNTFGNDCYNNTFGNNCGGNTFGNYCGGNTFGNNFQNNTFGNGCGSNTFGNDCNNNTFGNNCYYNTFGNDCYNNTFGNYIQYSTFNEGIQQLTLTNTGNNTYKYMLVLGGISNKNITSNVTPNKNYTQMIGVDSSGNVVVKNPLD